MTFWYVWALMVVLCYCIFLLYCLAHTNAMPLIKSKRISDGPHLAVLVSVYNGEKLLGPMFEFLRHQNYPPECWTLFITDDGSSDDTFNCILKLKAKMPCSVVVFQNLKPAGKKYNIQFMAERVTSKWILTLDSDGFSKNNKFLKSRVHYAETQNLDFSAGAITYTSGASRLLFHFQSIEHAVLHVLTHSAFNFKKPYLCSGANLLYKTDIFQKVGGLRSHMQISSGDDVLLLNAFKKYGAKMGFDAQEASQIQVLAPHTWRQFWKQKIRWASKSKYNSNLYNLLIASTVWMTSLIVLILPYMLWNSEYRQMVFLPLLIKMAIEFVIYRIYLYKQNIHYTFSLTPFLVLAIYPLYVLIIGFVSMLSPVTQKVGPGW